MPVEFPRLLLVRQKFPDRSLSDIPGIVHRELRRARLAAGLAPGSSIAIGVGSRGIANIATIVRAVVDFWKGECMRPFLFPAMGSHGAGTAQGQASVLAHYGIEEASMGCPVVSQLDVVSLGRTPEGIEAFLDRSAYEAGHIMLIGRVKWHTDFAGKIESGLFKMMAIGLGKFAGAQKYHCHGYKLGLETVVRSVGRQVLASGKILGGLAILEDALHNTAQLTAVRPEEMERKEEELVALVKGWGARIPAEQLDILIVNRMGKNISGSGLDTRIINRTVQGGSNCWPHTIRVERVFVRDLHDLSYGNAVGVGMADVITDRLLAKIDWKPSIVNAMTSGSIPSVRTPIHFPSDRECLECLAPTVGRLDSKDLRIGWIEDTQNLTQVAFSENMAEELAANPTLELAAGTRELEFGPDGNLVEWETRVRPATV